MIQFKKEEIESVKVGTIIGSTKFEEEMKDKARYLQSIGILSLITSITKEPTYFVSENTLMMEGYKRLDISDFAICINKDGYIGDNTAKEYYYATFIARIPVYFDCDKVSEKMIKYLNAFFIDRYGDCHIWNYSLLEKSDLIKSICIRNDIKISQDIIDIIENNFYDKEILSYILSSDLRKQYGKLDIPIPVIMLDNDSFESTLRKSKLFVPDTEEESIDK